MSLCSIEEGYPLEISTDDKCFFLWLAITVETGLPIVAVLLFINQFIILKIIEKSETLELTGS